MPEMTLTKTRFAGGIWEGLLTGADAAPKIAASHLGRAIEDVTVTADPREAGAWRVSVGIPADILSDGVQTVLVTDAASGATLATISLVAGEPLEDDIRAELDLLRAELDMLKRAFRRHCVETMPGM